MRSDCENVWSHDVRYGYATASISQGDQLYDAAREAEIEVNCCFDGELVCVPAERAVVCGFGEAEVTVLGPDEAALQALRARWRTAAMMKTARAFESLAAANDDRSIPTCRASSSSSMLRPGQS